MRHQNPYKSYPEEGFIPVLQDWFEVGWWSLRFYRGDSGAVAGFTIGAGRVKNIRFERSPGEASRVP